MAIAIIKEIKNNENRVALTPRHVKMLADTKQEILVEKGAGIGSGFSDKEYMEAGAKVVSTKDAWQADIVIKVKEPLSSEYKFFRQGLVLFTYLHLAGVDPSLAENLIKKKVTGIAYETVFLDGMLPLLTPMSEVAGRMSIQVASNYLAKHNGGRGVLLDGTSTVNPGKVVVIGCGIAGTNALIAATGRGCKVVAFDVKDEALARVKKQFGDKVNVMKSNPDEIKKQVSDADILVGAVLVPGAKAPKVISEDMIMSMPQGSVFVDIAIDQGGCSQTSKGTTHADPVYVKHGVTHYCVTNMPGAYPRTSTLALADATLPYVKKILEKGVEGLASEDPGFAKGINTYKGFLTNKDVAAALKKEKEFCELATLL